MERGKAPLGTYLERAQMTARVASFPSGHVFRREGERGPVWYVSTGSPTAAS
jgi:hypothetical protein